MKWIYRQLQRSIKPDKDGLMKYLIAGLGNFGEEYVETRHNIGFKVVDQLISEKQITTDPERFGDLGRFRLKNKEVYLLKPSTFMNRSGRAIYYWLHKLKIPTNRLLVVVDDVHLPFGIFRLRKSGSDGGHNGLKSIQEHLVTTHYPRFRIGIGNATSKGYKTDFVLGNWTEKEQQDLHFIISHASEVIQKFVLEGMDRTMNLYNRKTGSNLIED
jgi:PTH1 family peptidyl-tRNA hydrolase